MLEEFHFSGPKLAQETRQKIHMPKESISLASAPLGATVLEQSVAFKVWAPHADAVSVIGAWNDFKPGADPLELAGDGVWVGAVSEAAEGDTYRFHIKNGDQELSRIDPRAKEVTNSVGDGIIRADRFDWEGDDFQISPHNQLVIYELHAPTFSKADEKGEPALDAVIDSLSHIKRLGVNAIQIMPVAEFAGDVSWGYNPAHIYAVESHYGGPDALKRLVKAAHREGIAVILDVVYNHFGPSDLDLWRFDGWSENDLGGIYFYNDWRSETPWGNTRPDYGRGEVRQFIHDNAMMWLEEYHLDGLRMDMTLYMRHVRGDDDPGAELPEGWSLAQWVNGEIRKRFPGRILIAEDLRNHHGLTDAIEHDGAGFHSQWDAGFVHPVREALIKREDAWRSMQEIAEALTSKYNHDVFERVVYTESHDEVANGKARVPQEVNPDDPQGYHGQKRSCLGAGLVFTAPGIPMIFQGQEFLQGEWFRDDVPLDWDLKEDYSGIVRLYRDLIRLRRSTKGLTNGLTGQGILIHHLNEAENVLAFQRWSEHGKGDDVVVVCNFSHAPKTDYRIGFPDSGWWRLRLNSDAKIYSSDFADTACGDVEALDEGADHLPASGQVAIGPYSILIFSQDPE